MDNDLAANATIANVLSNTHHVHCIYYVGQNLIKNLKAKYSDTASYLNHALFNEKEHWAYCYSSNYFTTGMQLTQRVEGQNAIIKNSVNRSMLTHANSEFFPDYTLHLIENFKDLELQFDLTENVNSIEESDSIDQYEQFDLTEPTKQLDLTNISNTFIEDLIDAQAIVIKELIPSTKIESICEIWEFGMQTFLPSYDISNYAVFHIMLISKRWYNDEKQIEQESETQQHPFIFGLDSTKASINIEQAFLNLSF
ncbi:19576_t:CDS:2 [Gigaspora rosea]|nr:19576_t:CDS:2 [Gigaspora rosea]